MPSTLFKGVGEGTGGGSGGVCPHFQKWGAQVGFSLPPLLDGPSVLILLFFFPYFVAKNANFSWLASLANFTLSIFCNP